MSEPFGSDDLRVLSRYEHAGQGAWTTMPQQDKDSYLRIHARLEQIIETTLADLSESGSFDSCLTLGFNPNGGGARQSPQGPLVRRIPQRS